MPPQEFSFRLQKGIVGGFAPPTPDATVTVTKASNNSNLLIHAATRPAGERTLTDLAPKHLPVTHEDTDALLDELHRILKDLPTEQPPGSEDIYGLDTSIAWGSEDLEWCNGGPQGCGGGESFVKATEEHKAKFKRAVEIVHELAKKDV
ncbi:hypothetical protein FPV67DRAFT_1680717 [Lyophyllum atratum]|nr:hypothetical protein FPV67DRAFT_1680717 [Lyophyllum atratum]